MTAFVMADPLGEIVKQAAEKQMTQKQIALTYAVAIRQGEQGFKAANEAIIARWGLTGLGRIKNRAWKLIDGEVKP